MELFHVQTMIKCEDTQLWTGIRVSDTDFGISPAEFSQIFDRFYRGEAGRSSGTPGTGLGLSIAKEIIDRHYGRLEVVSNGIPGEGSTFIIWLPVFTSVQLANTPDPHQQAA
ncbi:MAG: HAMP domain-containing histidine kinase [Chloroflexi bacterium]|nr:HAMP domain-containing histidine kinase [Chloroflexota bacterium]